MKKIIVLSFVALSALVACNKADEPVKSESQSGEIVFKSSGLQTTVNTKATSEVTALDAFYVNCVTGTLGSAEVNVFNDTFEKETGDPTKYKSNVSGGRWWPDTDAGYKFYASNIALTFAATGATVSASNTTDVVCELMSSPSFKNVNTLTFEHIFARLGTVEIIAPKTATNETYTVTGLTVKMTPKISGTYNLFLGEGNTDITGWSNTSNGTETTIANTTGVNPSKDIYLVPDTYTLTVAYTLSLGEYTKAFNKTATVALAKGYINNIQTTLPSGDAMEIEFKVEVKAWDSQTVTPVFSE